MGAGQMCSATNELISAQSKCGGSITLLFWPGRLDQHWDAVHDYRISRLEGKLLGEKGDAVARGLSIQRMLRVVELNFLRLADDFCILFEQIRAAKWFVHRVLKKQSSWCGMRDVLSCICPGIPFHEGVELLGADFVSIILVVLRLLVSFIRKATRHEHECLETLINST